MSIVEKREPGTVYDSEFDGKVRGIDFEYGYFLEKQLGHKVLAGKALAVNKGFHYGKNKVYAVFPDLIIPDLKIAVIIGGEKHLFNHDPFFINLYKEEKIYGALKEIGYRIVFVRNDVNAFFSKWDKIVYCDRIGFSEVTGKKIIKAIENLQSPKQLQGNK